jgi:hypothetical protein
MINPKQIEVEMSLRISGHKLTIVRSTERSRSERSHTGQCLCGWEESCSTLKLVQSEYRHHLRQVNARTSQNTK